MMKFKASFIPLLLLTIGTCATAQELDASTFNKEMAIEIEGDTIAVHALIASGVQPKETVILLHGIPGNEKNLDLAQDLRSSGWNAIYFNYRGSWGSQGEYLYSNCLNDVKFLIEHLSQPKLADSLRINTNEFTLIGHSLGGGLALLQGATNNKVKKIIAVSAFNVGYSLRNDDSLESVQDIKSFLDELFMLNCNSEEFLLEWIDHKSQYNALTYREQLKNKSTLVIDELDRNHSWPGLLGDAIEYRIIPSDHDYSDKREELIGTIINWLRSN